MICINNLQKISDEVKKQLIEKICGNEFNTDLFQKLMRVKVSSETYYLTDTAVMSLTGEGIKQRCQRKKGMTAKQFFQEYGESDCYKIFPSENPLHIAEGSIICDPKPNGMYFTCREDEVYLFLQTGQYGQNVAVISFRDGHGNFIKDVHIQLGNNDTQGTFKAMKFYVKHIENADNPEVLKYYRNKYYQSLHTV